MKTVIYYFSGTGNTLYLAKLLAEKLGDTELVNIAHCDQASPDAERIGIMYPVYAFGLPKIVKRFVEDKLSTSADSYIFSLCNYASAGGPSSLRQLKSLLKKKKLKLSSGFGIGMPANYLPMGGAESEEQQKKRFAIAEKKIAEYANKLADSPGNYFYKKSKIPRCFSAMLYLLFMRLTKKAARKFFVDDSCTSCGLCEKICPTKNISLVDGKPCWSDNCEQCAACVQWCPSQSIQIKGVAATRKHYHHPAIKAKEFLN